MKLIINTESLRYPLRGMGNYIFHLLQNIQSAEAAESILCFNGSDALLSPTEATAVVGQPTTAPHETLCTAHEGSQDEEAINALFTKLTEPHSDALYIEPECFRRPFSGKCLPVIYDLSPLRHPEFHDAAHVQRMTECTPKSITEACHIITPSDFTRREISSLWNTPQSKITVIPPGVKPVFQPMTSQETEPVRKKYGLDKMYLLMVGTLEPKKNFTNLIAAHSRLPEKIRKQHPLVIAGAKGWGSERLENVIATHEAQGTVQWLGFVPPDDLPFLYAGAYGFVYTSIYEGLGISVLEAMASGIPVLTSNQSALPEIGDKVALLTNPRNLSDLTQNLERLIRDEDLRAKVRKAGLERAKSYSWQASMEKLTTLLHSLAK